MEVTSELSFSDKVKISLIGFGWVAQGKTLQTDREGRKVLPELSIVQFG